MVALTAVRGVAGNVVELVRLLTLEGTEDALRYSAAFRFLVGRGVVRSSVAEVVVFDFVIS
jgi:hypothetical protein